ncbi:hypothetical protein [Vibrio agarivorans]|uniref:Uncharacterized protein n=1 Tax=Vibrio agarivorans TaxID=153622 RepID=A0ABT7Y0V1_9VIBR|nr:hypothetical protein [Vibrio agarivorans]MDN2481656.1 hypothetical protein [Vibrio agarivorans]
MPSRDYAASKLLKCFLEEQNLTSAEAKEVIGQEHELSRVLDIIRNKWFIPVECSRTGNCAIYYMSHEAREMFHEDRGTLKKEKRSQVYRDRYLALRSRMFKEMVKPGGVERMKTLFHQALERAEAANDPESKKDSD